MRKVAQMLPDWQNLSLKEQIGQMVVVRASGYLFDHQIRYPTWEPPAAKLKSWLQDLNLGGVILLGGSAPELALRTEQLQNWANLPLLMAADIEEGVGQWFEGATRFPPPMALGAIFAENPDLAAQYARKMGAITAQESIALGINWILAPVVDVNNNPDNPVINVRSFAANPTTVSNLATAFIEGAKSYTVLTTAKHFPGHGDTTTDSHLDLPVLPHSAARLAEVELPPFIRAIAAGVDSVMSAHVLIPTWDQHHPATLSAPILTGQLRQRLGFEGLIVTDALVMGGVVKHTSAEEIAVMAVAAGVDILLMPQDPEVAINAVYRAVQSERLSTERIHNSLERIWRTKNKVIYTNSLLNLSKNITKPESRQAAAEIVRADLLTGGDLPLKPGNNNQKRRNLIIVDDLLNCNFISRHVPAVTIPQKLGYEVQLADQNNVVLEQDTPPKTLLQLFIRGNPFRGTAGLNRTTQELIQKLLNRGSIEGLILYGSPYVLDWLRGEMPPNLPWAFSHGQMPMAQAIACQSLFGLSDLAEKKPETFL